MRFEITSPCDEPWESMQLRPGGRFCQRCEKTVIDLSKMTRAQAEQRLRGMEGPEVCVQLDIDRFGDAVFRAPPTRAPHWVGGLVLVTALTAGGCSTAGPSEPEITMEASADPGPPMMPVGLATIAPQPMDEMVTGAVPSSELVTEDGEARPTAEQRRLTANKQRPAISVMPQHQGMRGGMALNWPSP